MKKLLVLFAVGLVASSCVPSTPQARIQQHPEIYASLSPKQQALVQRGELVKGMPPQAVVLAWGPPSMRYEGYHKGNPSMRWDYTGSRAVYSGQYYGMYGYGGYGYHGRYGYPYSGYGYGFGFAPELAYVPYRTASVWFVNNQVDGWDRLR